MDYKKLSKIADSNVKDSKELKQLKSKINSEFEYDFPFSVEGDHLKSDYYKIEKFVDEGRTFSTEKKEKKWAQVCRRIQKILGKNYEVDNVGLEVTIKPKSKVRDSEEKIS